MRILYIYSIYLANFQWKTYTVSYSASVNQTENPNCFNSYRDQQIRLLYFWQREQIRLPQDLSWGTDCSKLWDNEGPEQSYLFRHIKWSSRSCFKNGIFLQKSNVKFTLWIRAKDSKVSATNDWRIISYLPFESLIKIIIKKP